MKSLLRLAFSALLLCGLCSPALAQLSGTISVPTATYPTLDSVVKLLNAQGVGTGGLTVTLTAGQNAPAGGYQLGSAVLNASLTAAKPLIINGGNNTIAGQTGTSGFDAVFALFGTDYVTLNGLNISATSGTTATQKIEIGVGLLKLNGTAPYDGCQNVTVSNCTITLSNILGTSGIYAGHVYASGGVVYNAPVTGAVASDANSNNVFKRNTLSGMTQGIVCVGIVNVAGAWDYNNTIGGPLPIDGNTITLGPNSAVPNSFAVYVNYDSTLTVQNNAFPSSNAQNGVFYNMYMGQTKGIINILNNSLDVTSSGTT